MCIRDSSQELVKILGFSSDLAFIKYCYINGFPALLDAESMMTWIHQNVSAIKNQDFMSSENLKARVKKENGEKFRSDIRVKIDFLQHKRKIYVGIHTCLLYTSPSPRDS
eukprot:TRINITY_DN22568_c0_g1_i1.p1 TRINITY_DN22568_c0_g1~~TRINITY_DN22568_c0_g1_i1.p1  ORF type:complete len:110 (-),score=15.07 TRINITY_DN22568_c0_g1_i1:36-365(-)